MLLNIQKYLVFASIFITFTSAQTNQAITICEDKTSTVSCSNNKAITIVRALFGRNRNNRECLFLNGIFRIVKSCSVFGGSTLRLVKDRCEGQQSCHLTANRNIFGDPCMHVKKYLEVVYKCVERQLLVPAMTTITGNMDITIQVRDIIKDPTTISIWILIVAIVGSVVLSFILAVCVVHLFRRKKRQINKKDYVCKYLEREQPVVRKIQCDYQSEISTVSNHLYDALEPDEHSYISVI